MLLHAWIYFIGVLVDVLDVLQEVPGILEEVVTSSLIKLYRLTLSVFQKGPERDSMVDWGVLTGP